MCIILKAKIQISFIYLQLYFMIIKINSNIFHFMVTLQTTIELYNMKFNQKIKALRKSANMNQQELADKLHIHVTHLSKMENGHLLPSIDIVQRLMKVFAVSADNLLNDSEDSVVEMQNHELNEQLMLINQLDEDEKNALVKIINSMLTKKRMKDLLDGKVSF
jgi:transcriptional regulator with XRE-family HTH domain